MTSKLNSLLSLPKQRKERPSYHVLAQREFFFSFSTPRTFPPNGNPSLLCPSFPNKDKYRNINLFSIGYPSNTRLTLGPDSPSMDEPSGGTLRFSEHWILTNVFVTQADILTSASSTSTHVDASP
jgi:hypothetical protein